MSTVVVVISFVISLVISYFHAKKGTAEKLIWPEKFVINIGHGFGLNSITKESLDKELSRKDFSFREQFIAAIAIWWFIGIFILGLFLWL